LVQSRVPVDEVLLLSEEAAGGQRGMGPPGGGLEMMRGGRGEGMTAAVAGAEGFRAFEAGGQGRDSEVARRFSQLASGTVGITTEMQKLFYQTQRRVRLVAVMDFRDLPVLIEALLNMKHFGTDTARLSLVRSVSVSKTSEFGEAPLKPEVRVDIRALCFDRYQEFVESVVPEMEP